MADFGSSKQAAVDAYEDVRNDSTPTLWALLGYEGNTNTLVLVGTGSDYEEFTSKFTADERLFGFLRVTSGDELSKRAKFVLLTWIGENTSALKRAKVSTDKASVKAIWQNIALELQITDVAELQQDHIREVVTKAGGAAYGTGVRD